MSWSILDTRARGARNRPRTAGRPGHSVYADRVGCRQLLYHRDLNPDRGEGHMMAVSVETTGQEPKLGMPRALFSAPYQGEGDIAPDGRFLLLQRTRQESPSRVIQLVLNWFDELQAKAPLH